MPLLIEHVTEMVWAMIFVVLLATTLIITITLLRRHRREKYFRQIDNLREHFSPLITALLAGTLDFEQGRDTLRAISGKDRIHALELLLLEKKPKPAQVPILRKLCQELGLVEEWERRLNGQGREESLRDALSRTNGVLGYFTPLNYVVQATSAQNLGTILHQPSWPLLAKALGDVYPDVGSVSARSLAAIAEPESFQVLLDRLHAVILNPSDTISLRSIKMALVGFPLDQSTKILPSLKHPHRRIRFMAVDIIREIVERQAALDESFVLNEKCFSPGLAEIFLGRLCSDENPDVRARTAPVIAYLPDSRSTPTLLTLLEDEQWFVRLHAARALAKQRYMSCAQIIALRLTDAQWMVREAATRTLLAFGRAGIEQLLDQVLTTHDRWSKEQIADEIQRAGLIPTLLSEYASQGGNKATRVLQELADLGKTSCLLAVVTGSSDRNLRTKFLANFGRHSDPQIRSWVKATAARDPDAEVRERAASMADSAPRGGAGVN